MVTSLFASVTHKLDGNASYFSSSPNRAAVFRHTFSAWDKKLVRAAQLPCLLLAANERIVLKVT